MERFDSSKKLNAKQLFSGTSRVTTKDEANRYLKDIVAYYIAYYGWSYQKSYDKAIIEIGYYSAFFKKETAERVRELFNAPYPSGG